MRKSKLWVAAAAVVVSGLTASASPMVYLSLLGRQHGTTDPYTHALGVVPGQTIDYEVVLQMAPIGTTNTQGTTTRSIDYWSARAGLNSMTLDLFQNPNDPVQIDLTSGATLNTDPGPASNDSWSAGTGANGGTARARNGNSAYHDLIAIRPIHSAGVFTGVDPEVVLTGSFTVPQASDGANSLVRLRWSTDPNTLASGAFAINDGVTTPYGLVFITKNTEATADPFIAIDPPLVQSAQALTTSDLLSTASADPGYALQLTLAPEPSSITLCAAGALGLLRRRRRS